MTFRSAFVTLALALGVIGSMHFGRMGAAGGSIVGTIGGLVPGEGNAAVVYVEQAPGAFTPTAAKLDQKDMEFLPYILPVLVGTTVTFANSDPAPHMVFSGSQEKFNLGVVGPNQTKDQAFGKCAKFPCVYTLLCPMHPEMEGFVVVLQNPFFAMSSQDGHYVIENVPEGKYNVGVWHPRLKGQVQAVTATSSGPATLDFTLKR